MLRKSLEWAEYNSERVAYPELTGKLRAEGRVACKGTRSFVLAGSLAHRLRLLSFTLCHIGSFFSKDLEWIPAITGGSALDPTRNLVKLHRHEVRFLVVPLQA